MKIRIQGNSVRFRFQMSEIKKLDETGLISETIRFSLDQNLGYAIRTDSMSESISGSFENNEILVRIPSAIAENWIHTEKVGLEFHQVIDDDISLNILLEKDFKCLTRRDGEADMFPNPKEVHA